MSKHRSRASNGWAALAEVVTGAHDPGPGHLPGPALKAAATAPYLPVTELQSPMAPAPSGILNAMVWADVMGADAQMPLTRAAAIRIPAVARARHLLVGLIARMPLQAFRGSTLLPDEEQPTWLYRTDYGLPPFHRMLWTIDDLIFTGWSLWARNNGSDTYPLAATRVPTERWRFTSAAVIQTRGDDGQWHDARREDVILIPGPHEGICNFGGQAVREAADLARAASDAAANPSAYLNLHYTGDEPQTPEQIDALIARWAAARRGLNGGVAYTNKWIEVHEMGTHEAHLLTEGRNAAAVDMARIVGIPAAMIDATTAQASLTYETTAGRNAEFIDYGGNLYMDSVTARLSMDDVVPRGTRVAFDTTEARTPAPIPTGPATQD